MAVATIKNKQSKLETMLNEDFLFEKTSRRYCVTCSQICSILDVEGRDFRQTLRDYLDNTFVRGDVTKSFITNNFFTVNGGQDFATTVEGLFFISPLFTTQQLAKISELLATLQDYETTARECNEDICNEENSRLISSLLNTPKDLTAKEDRLIFDALNLIKTYRRRYNTTVERFTRQILEGHTQAVLDEANNIIKEAKSRKTLF